MAVVASICFPSLKRFRYENPFFSIRLYGCTSHSKLTTFAKVRYQILKKVYRFLKKRVHLGGSTFTLVRMVKCVVIDDEKNSRDFLVNLIGQYCPDISVIGTASGGVEGLQTVAELKPDAVFLDIRMSDMDGFTVMQRLPEPRPMVIFVTAYQKYALRAIKASAIDYLLKPVNIGELQDTSRKLKQLHELRFSNPHFRNEYNDALKLVMQSASESQPLRIALPHHNGYRFERMNQIVRLESDSNYTTVFLESGEKVMVSKPMKHFEDFLDESMFIRIHNSHIINMKFLKSYNRDKGVAELEGQKEIPISKRRLAVFMEAMKKTFYKP